MNVGSARGGGGGGGSGGRRSGNDGREGKSGPKRDYRKGVKLRTYTLQDKKEMVEMMKSGARNCEIMRRFNCPESTVRSLRKNKDNLAASVNVFSRFSSARTLADTSLHNRLLAITEHYLHEWVQRRNREQGDLSGVAIRAQARVFFAAVCRKKNVNPPPPFTASVGWLASFKHRYEVKYAIKKGESGSADVEAAKGYPDIFKKLVEEGGYCHDQLFNCDETGIFWKRSPKSTFIAKAEKQARGVKMSKDRFTVLLTSNASGDCLMKPLVVYRAARPRAYKHANMGQLNVYWTHNKKAWVTTSLCSDWFDKHFVRDAQRYCQRKNLDFKVVLLMDNAPGHGKFLVGRHPSVQVIFLPANTTSLLQPLDHEFISNVKLFYYQSVYEELREKTDSLVELNHIEAELSDIEIDEPAVQPAADPTPSTSHEPAAPSIGLSTAPPRNREVLTVAQFWKNYNIKNAVDKAVDAWHKINKATVLHAWKPLLGTTEAGEAGSVRQCEATTLTETLEAARSVPAPGFSEVEAEELQELIGQRHEELTIEDMLQEDEEQEQEPTTQEENVQPGEPTTQQLTEVLTTMARLSEQLQDYDKRPHPRSIFCPSLEKIMGIYNDLYMSRVNARHQALITRYLRNPANALANVTAEAEDDDERVPDEEIADLGDLQVGDIPMDFEGFEAELTHGDGGAENGAGEAAGWQ